MEKASPVEMRNALEVVRNFKEAGVLFVAMPVKGIEDRIELQKQALCRLESLALMAEKETPNKDFEQKLVEVCGECKQASCWYGEFMCFEARDAGTELKTVSELRELSLEHEDNWSDKKMNEVCGDPAPNGYKTGTMEEYTGPRRCDLCKFEKDAPCPGKGCNSVNKLKDFKPKGVQAEGSPEWDVMCFSYDKDENHFIHCLKNNDGNTIMVTLTPDEIASFANNN